MHVDVTRVRRRRRRRGRAYSEAQAAREAEPELVDVVRIVDREAHVPKRERLGLRVGGIAIVVFLVRVPRDALPGRGIALRHGQGVAAGCAYTAIACSAPGG